MKKNLLNVIILALMLVLPALNFAQAPDLGTAADFVLFTSNGEVKNEGATYLTILTGNVGSNSQATSPGFGNVDGTMYFTGNAVTQECADDLDTAYYTLDTTTAIFFPAPLLGNGATLPAGVYSISGAASLELDLTLDAEGNPDAVFIFQIEGAFSTAANSEIILINGAQACNVFWKIEGLVDMATGTNMKGTIIANNFAIVMGSGVKLEGRALSTVGAITVNGLQASLPIGCGSPVLTGPTAPDLASTECYALFTGNGGMTNTGESFVIGDVGTQVGLTTGFEPLNVTGTVHANPDVSTQTALEDLIVVYDYLNLLDYDIELLYPVELGHYLVLTPHTYLLNAATVLTDTLYLDAQGNPDAVFVIQIKGALSTSTYSKVLLINEAQAENVFWIITEAVEINEYSVFSGIIVSAGAINLKSEVTLNGKALTTTGAFNTAAITTTMPTSCETGLAPEITEQPANQTECEGSSVSFTVEATGTNLTYQWRKGTTDLTNTDIISGATSATLTINPVAVSDAASDYNVVITGTYPPNVTSANASLVVNFPPEITEQPANQTECEGSLVGFSVTATGTDLTYQWKKGTVELTNSENISGVTTATLSINPVAITDAASDYNVVISGTCAPSLTSTDASIVVNSAPEITAQPVDQSVNIGDPASFSVTATGTDLTYQWRKGTAELTNSDNISGVTLATLTIDPVAAIDSATNYNVVISGTCLPAVTSEDVLLSIIATSIDIIDGNTNKALTIYPNPFKSSINIELNDALLINRYELKVYNALGIEVINTIITKKLTKLETSNFVSGIYFYKVVENNKTVQSGQLIYQE